MPRRPPPYRRNRNIIERRWEGYAVVKVFADPSRSGKILATFPDTPDGRARAHEYKDKLTNA